MARKKILMAMIEVGFGHKAPADAVKRLMEELWPDRYIIDVVDFPRQSGALNTDKSMKDSWDFMLAFPASGRISYLLMELLHFTDKSYINLIFGEFVEKGIEYLNRCRPDLFFATHPICLYVGVKAREKHRLPMKIVAYVVDPFDGYSWWANEGADVIMVASEQSRKRLIKHGIDPARIEVLGFPVNRRFFEIIRSQAEVRADLNLDADKPTLLCTAGGQGIGRVYSFIESAWNFDAPVNIISVAGKNEKTKRRIDAVATTSKRNCRLVSLGYVTTMNELMNASDVVVGKAGASTAMESMFLGKPMIFTEWATFNDRYIIDFALDNHIGWYAPSSFAFRRVIDGIVQRGELAIRRRNLADMNLEPGTERVARYLDGMMTY